MDSWIIDKNLSDIGALIGSSVQFFDIQLSFTTYKPYCIWGVVERLKESKQPILRGILNFRIGTS